MTPDVTDLQRRARKLLPPEVYDYYAGWSGGERTLRANQKGWRRVWLAPAGIARCVGSIHRRQPAGNAGGDPGGRRPDQVCPAIGPLADPGAAAQASDLTFADIGWLAEISGLPVVVKGVLTARPGTGCR